MTDGDQLAMLAPARRGRARVRSAQEPAAALPVARVVVDTPLAHLDRPFDYLVPTTMDGEVVAGSRVRVRFAGRLVDGFVLERTGASEHAGRLAYLSAAVSSEPVLTPEVAGLAREVADRYAGTMADVLRLAVPPRHARAEAAAVTAPDLPPSAAPQPGPWAAYTHGAEFVRALAAGAAPHAVWAALPGSDGWRAAITVAVRATLAAGRGAIVLAPDARDVAGLDAALAAELGQDRHTVLTADLGPAERYRRFLAVSRGQVRCVLGTRAAAFAPVADLGLVVIWDDGDDLYAEPRAPYPHARDVLLLRAHRAKAAALVAGHAMTTEAAQLVESGWAHPLVAPREVLRTAAPRVEPVGEDAELDRDLAARAARLPTSAFRVARAALAAGAPVLVQVPRRGYQPSLSCARCRIPAHCAVCSGPLGRAAGDSAPACRWCGRPAADWACGACGSTELRAGVVGARRTAEELGKAFPGVAVRTSGGDSVIAAVPATPALVVATPGAEPVAEGGYGAVLLLDAWLLLARADLRAGEEAVRRWMVAAALARPAHEGGRVVITADASLPAVQTLVRWDPAWYARRELAERAELGFPPAVRMAALTGEPQALSDVLAGLELPPEAVLGPVPVTEVAAPPGTTKDKLERALVRVPRTEGSALAARLKAVQATRAARKETAAVRVVLDPIEIG